MVGRRTGEERRVVGLVSGEDQRVTSDHMVSHNQIRELIQSAIAPLRVDPVPTSVLIHNIVITKDTQGQLTIRCDVSYETETPA